jgi:hypothetical protein
MNPFTKYFCKNGYIIMIGTVVTTIVASRNEVELTCCAVIPIGIATTVFEDAALAITRYRYVWIGCKCVLLKGAEVPDNTVVAAGTLLTSSFSGEHQVIGGNPPTVLKHDICWEH